MHSYKYSPKLNILDLPAGVINKIRNVLDNGGELSGWRTLLASIRDDNFIFTLQEVEMFAMAMYRNGSPSQQMLGALGTRNFTVAHLVDVLSIMKQERLLSELKNYEPIIITLKPEREVQINAGETLCLRVKATGFPYPRYQWFVEQEKVCGAMSDELEIKNITVEDSGKYFCRLHNSRRSEQVKFTEETRVIVKAVAESRNMYPDDYIQLIPKILMNPPTSMNVFVGNEFQLCCQAVGQAPLQYQWWKDGSCISTSSLFLNKEATLSDTGRYWCTVENRRGKTQSVLVSVHVQSGLSYNERQKTLEIIKQPKSCSVAIDGVALFVCDADSVYPLRYSWLKDGIKLENEYNNELKIEISGLENEGIFQCVVSSSVSDDVLVSQPALLKINQKSLEPEKSYLATDKVALLIGNDDYRNEKKLFAPKYDVALLAEIFRFLDFKVVSLLNLTLTEMNSAVHEFSQLLGPGVYGVFYFAGHGFDEVKQSYLVPQDAPAGYNINNCVCAENVLKDMQKNNPALCCMILDICRKENHVKSKNPPIITPVARGNTYCFYATMFGLGAYEDTQNGLLVKYLQKHIRKAKGIEEMFADVRQAIGEDPSIKEIQIPQATSNLQEPLRSFADKIDYRGFTQEFQERTKKWKDACVKPKIANIVDDSLKIELELDFQEEFSNILRCFVTVKNPGRTVDCVAWMSKYPSTLSAVGRPVVVTEKPYKKTRIILQDIQKLQSSLQANISIKYHLEGSKIVQTKDLQVDLGYPLVSGLKLWQPRNNGREGMEQEDSADSSFC